MRPAIGLRNGDFSEELPGVRIGPLAKAQRELKPDRFVSALEQRREGIRDRIERVVPGFADYNRRIGEPGGFHLPNPARDRVFKTRSGRAVFTVHPLPRHDLQPGQFLMMTIRSHDQFNTSIYGLDDRYRGIHNGRRAVLLNRDDMRLADLSEGQVVDLISHFEGEERVARNFIVVPYSIPRRCAATYFPETNVLVPLRSVAEKSNTPTSKSVVISIRPLGSSEFAYDHLDGTDK